MLFKGYENNFIKKLKNKKIKFPIVIKPVNEGSSLGVYICKNKIQFNKAASAIIMKSNTFSLDATTIVLDSSANDGKIALGDTPPTSVAYTSNAGIYMDGTGDFLVRGDDDNYIKMYSNTIDIKSEVFDLDAGTLLLSSATNGGKFALGHTPPTGFNSGNGIYMDGNANFLVGSASADHIQYNAGSNAFDVKVGSLELDASNIEISSVNASMSLGEGNILLDGANSRVKVGSSATKQITLQGHADYGYIATGKTSATDTTSGFWLANNNELYDAGIIANPILFNIVLLLK